MNAIRRRDFVILLPFLLSSCQTQPAQKSSAQKPAAAQLPAIPAPSTPPPAKPAPAKEVMTRFTAVLLNGSSASATAKSAATVISARVKSCWQGPVVPDAPEIALRIALNEDGTVKTISVLDKKAFTANAAYRATATAATTAFFKCGPFVLPSSAYAAWKSLDLQITPHH
jgi:hypothetical protein